MKLLIVEDELDFKASLEQYLKGEGFIVESASNFEEGIDKINVYDYDCLVLDINIPGGSGLQLLEALKKAKKKSSVIIISANNTLEDKLKGLGLGADDYLTKPFHLSELNARINAVLRRNQLGGENVIQLNELTLDVDAKNVLVNSTRVELTRKEYLLLEFFMVNANRVLSKESISEHLWGDYIDQADSFDFIYSHLKNLRKKLITAGSQDYIKTVYGIGYTFKTE